MFFVDSEKKLAPDSTSLEGPFAAGDSDCFPGGVCPPGLLFLLGCPLRSPNPPHPLQNTQEFLPLRNELLTLLLSNIPVGFGALLPASETSISSPVHLTEDSFLL